MNYDPNYTRVRVRRELIPLLTTFNPKIVAGLARTAETLRNDKHCNPPERLKGQNAVSQPPLLAIDQLKILDKADRYDLIRKWLRQNRGDLRGLGLKHIEAVEQLAVSTKSGRMVQIPGSFTVIKSNGALRLKKNEVEN